MPYIKVQKQRQIKNCDRQNRLDTRGFGYIRPLYNEIPVHIRCYLYDRTVLFSTLASAKDIFERINHGKTTGGITVIVTVIGAALVLIAAFYATKQLHIKVKRIQARWC